MNMNFSKNTPSISVVICTYNRADRLRLALEALCTQTLPPQSFEILVVDNASTDDTAAICTSYKEKLPQLHYLFEPVQGLSRARNTAWEKAKSSYIAYLDDDAIPCDDWIESILLTFETVQPKPVSVGGPIYPLWEIPKPDWIHPSMETIFTTLDGGDKPRWFKSNEHPWGANVAYRRDALEKTGGFREQLGRKGKSLLSGEEYLLNATLERQGERFYYSPRAWVSHWVPKERINPDWLVRRSYWQGRSVALIDTMLGKSLLRQRLGSTWHLLKVFLNLRTLISQVWPDPKIRVGEQMGLSWRWGYFSQIWLDSFNRGYL